MYYPVEVFLLGAASGATVALFFLLGLWFHHKDAALTLDMQSQMDFFFSKAMVWAFMMSFFCAIIAFSGLTLAGGTLPRLAWSIGAVVGTAAILILR